MNNNQPVDIYGKPYNRTLLAVVLLIGTLCTALNQTLLTTVFPTLTKAFDISTSDAQWLATGFLLVNGIMTPIAAWPINKFSSGNLYLSAMMIFLIGTITCFTAPNFSTLPIGRLIQACGVGVSMPLLQNIMLSIFLPEKRGSATGMSGIVIGLAPALGPTSSGYITDNYHWRDLFGMVLLIVVLVLVLAFFLMKGVIPLSNPSIDILSTISSTIGFGSLLYGFPSAGGDGWGSLKVIGSLVADAIFIALFSWRQLHLEHSFLELRVSKLSTLTTVAVLAGVTNMAMVGVETVVPLYIQNIRGKSAFHFGSMLLPGALIMGAMMPVTDAIFNKYGAKCLAITGMFISIAATASFAFLTKTTPALYIVILYAIRMLRISMVMMPVMTSGMDALPNNLISHGTAVSNTFRQIVNSIDTAILISVSTNATKVNIPSKSVLDNTPLAYKDQATNAIPSGYHVAFIVATIFGIPGSITAFLLKKKRPVLTKAGDNVWLLEF